MEKHVTIVAAINLAFGGILFGIGLIAFVAIALGGMLSGDMEAVFITSTVASIIGIFFTVLSFPSIISGFGLLSRKHWARIVAIITSIINLVNIPVGTIIAIYSMWVLLHSDTIALFNAQSEYNRNQRIHNPAMGDMGEVVS